MTYPVEIRHLKRLNVHVKSSLLEALEYDPESHQLNVEYKRKGLFGSRKIRSYDNISPAQFFELIGAESIGKALLRLVKKSEKLEGVY